MEPVALAQQERQGLLIRAVAVVAEVTTQAILCLAAALAAPAS